MALKRDERPWGFYEVIAEADGYKVKRIVVKPKGQLSLQYHHKREEHWVIVKGKATVTKGEEVLTLNPSEHVFLPKGITHRLENFGEEDLEMIEVQYGDYLGEDDIVRIEDAYQRVHP